MLILRGKRLRRKRNNPGKERRKGLQFLLFKMREKLHHEQGSQEQEMDKDQQEGKGKGMKLVFLGPPGSGKGTYASRISTILGWPQISTGDLLRGVIKGGTSLGKEAEKFYNEGKLVPDEIVLNLLKERLSKPDCRNGFILDGFPRSIEQARKLEGITKVDLVVNLAISEEGIILRLSTRRVCRKCGAIYNIRNVKPKVEGVCDKCGGELYQRDDDKTETIRKRLKV